MSFGVLVIGEVSVLMTESGNGNVACDIFCLILIRTVLTNAEGKFLRFSGNKAGRKLRNGGFLCAVLVSGRICSVFIFIIAVFAFPICVIAVRGAGCSLCRNELERVLRLSVLFNALGYIATIAFTNLRFICSVVFRFTPIVTECRTDGECFCSDCAASFTGVAILCRLCAGCITGFRCSAFKFFGKFMIKFISVKSLVRSCLSAS